MRYIKLFLAVFIFFIFMLFFVQNMAPFSQEVVLKLDFMFMQPVESTPVPLYTIIILAFTTGALLVLLMLLYDRLALSARCRLSSSKVSGLEKKLAKSEANFAQCTENAIQKETLLTSELEQVKLDLEETRSKLDELRRNYNQ